MGEVTLVVVSVNEQLWKGASHMKEGTSYYLHHLYAIMLLSNYKITFYNTDLLKSLYNFLLLTNAFHEVCNNIPYVGYFR